MSIASGRAGSKPAVTPEEFRAKLAGSRQSARGKLSRTTFSTSRLLDFLSRKELIAQTGHDVAAWPLVILKELVDNVLDACEEAGVPPKINVMVDDDSICVRDNGPGIPPETVESILDFSVRVSSREAYISPTRGAQGNALKTIIAMPFVLDGKQGRVDVSARGTWHEITLGVDAVRQVPVVNATKRPDRFVKTGTLVNVYWPDVASSILAEAKPQFLQIARAYGFLNPHLALTVNWQDEETEIAATDPGWRKWLPSEPTSPHWYTAEQFNRLVAGYLGHDQDSNRDRTIRAFVGEFRGLSGSAKQKAVLEATSMHRLNLSGMLNGTGVDAAKTSALLAAMKTNSKEVKPIDLGLIGKSHLHQRCQELGGQMESFEYKKVVEVEDGVPSVLETAFVWCPKAKRRTLVTGVNWSPGIVNPFRQLGKFGQSLDTILSQQELDAMEPGVLVLHLACPRVQYTDRGKSAVVIDGEAEQPADDDDDEDEDGPPYFRLDEE